MSPKEGVAWILGIAWGIISLSIGEPYFTLGILSVLFFIVIIVRLLEL